MNRATVPALAVLGLALAVLGTAAIGVQQPSAGGAPADDRARVSVVCPNVDGTVNPTAVAAGSPGGDLATASLARPDQVTPVTTTLHVTAAVTAPMVVSAPRLDAFSASSRTASTSGSDRGLSMTSCDRPTASQWFAGVTSSADGSADVVLLNSDDQDATVDIAVYGPEGRVNAPGSRGIIVPARTRRVLPLGPLFSAPQAVSLHVSTSAGRVAALVRQRILRSDRHAGSDWLPPTADPATAIVIPGIPAGRGLRDLIVVNPGERTASVTLQVLGAGGPTAVPGFETLDLPPQASQVIPLSGALARASVGLRLSSEQKITAGVISGSGGAVDTADVSTQVATTVLGGPGVLALSPARRVRPALHLASGSTEPVQVRVVVSSAAGTLADTTVTVPALADTMLRLPRAADVLIAVEPQSPGIVHASVAVRARLDDVIGVSSLAVHPGAAAAVLPPIRQDPRVGT